jgi:hypothetical protein
MNTEILSRYYSHVQPVAILLKEHFRLEEMEKALEDGKIRIDRSPALDAIFINEAQAFLQQSFVNLLAYKFLMGGGYLAWGHVTLYFSQFHAANSLLRLTGKAAVHLDEPGGKHLKIQIVRDSNLHGYSIHRLKQSDHDFVWRSLASLYNLPNAQELIRYVVGERVKWNYDMLFPSQSDMPHAKDHRKIMAENNFLDPNFAKYADPDAAEYYDGLRRDYGVGECFAGELIEDCVTAISEIGSRSDYRESYEDSLIRISEHLNNLDGFHPLRETLRAWIEMALITLRKA